MTHRAGRTLVLSCFALLVVFVSATKIADYDFWWHLKLGETVYNSGGPYGPDEFSYTFEGRPQFNSEWLADLVMFLCFRAGGFTGIALFKITALLFTFLFLYRTLEYLREDDDAGFYASVLTLVVILFSLRFRLFVRPYIFSFLFLSIVLYLLSRFDRTRDLKILIFFPAVMLLWANSSKLAFYGPLVFLSFIIGDAFSGKKIRAGLVVIFLAAAACSLLNPEAYRIYLYPFGVTVGTQAKEVVGEHQPLSFQLLWGYGLKYTFAYQILVAGSLCYLIFLRGWKNIYHLMLFTVFFVQSVMMVRAIDFFSLSATVLCIAPAARLLGIVFAQVRSRMALAPAICSVMFLVLIPLSVLGSRTYAFGVGMKADAFPEEAVAFLERERITGRMFNSYAFGGYLIWRSPERKVFIDGRGIGALYSDEFYNGYFAMLKDAEKWKAAEQKWGFDYAVLEYDPLGRRYPLHLNEDPDWAPVYWDNHSVVYLKRIDKYRDVILSHEYKVAKPNLYDFSYLQAYLHSKTGPAAVEQLNREIVLNPENQEPRLAKAFLLFNMGKSFHGEILKELQITLTLKPDLAMEHSAMAIMLLEKGADKAAREEVKKALALDPQDAGAKSLLKKLGM